MGALLKWSDFFFGLLSIDYIENSLYILRIWGLGNYDQATKSLIFCFEFIWFLNQFLFI